MCGDVGALGVLPVILALCVKRDVIARPVIRPLKAE